jgi:ubiquinone/menaquinone biosynthesis C-methylase UbiE
MGKDPLKHSFELRSYERHIHNWSSEIRNAERKKVHEAWFSEGTIDFWRHLRMYEQVFECLKNHKDDSWLTVGDGRYGLDAIRMKRRGFYNVFPTDITGELLWIARESKLIEDYGVENAESMSFNDNSFDYLLCKEAFHHFPRPFLALYEMLRVAREAVVLIEPQDQWIDLPSLAPPRSPKYEEEDGNFIYSISRRELEKIALGMNYRTLAFKNIFDHYEDGLEFEVASESNPRFLNFKTKIEKFEHLCSQGSIKYPILMAVLFKRDPCETDRILFRTFGWDMIDYPSNPHHKETTL